MDTSQYLSMFIEEAKDHLQALNENLLALEQNQQDIGIVQVIFRSAHTLKGMSATMGFNDLASLTHEMENVLDLVRNHKLTMDSFIFDCMFKGTDCLESMVVDIINGGTGSADVEHLVEALGSIVTGKYKESPTVAAAVSAKQVKSTGLDEYQLSALEQSVSAGFHALFVEVTLRSDCVLKAARAYMVFDIFESSGEVIKSYPSVPDIEQEKFDRTFSVYLITKVNAVDIETRIASVSEIETVQINQLDVQQIQELTNQTASSLVQAEISPSAGRGIETDKKTVPAAVGAVVSNRTIRVDIDRLDTLMNLFSELLIDRVRLEQLAGEIKRGDLLETVEHMSRVSTDLQNIVLKLRMVPIDMVFNRFPRMIRDIAKNLDKKVDLIITGADTELDRTVVDEIGDPLVHLLRNAIDHGVETTQERISSGKAETGTIWLRAFHSGNHVFIEIEEDGRGINRDRVLKAAIKNGVVTLEQANQLADKEVFELLFASGFSTAEQISDISGRGVGLDVVKTKIESLGGHVEVDSTLGKGTKFSIQLPLTLSIISAMLVRVGNEKFAIPLSSIVETAVVSNKDIQLIHGTQLLNYRKGVIPVIMLSKVLDVPLTGSEQDETELVIIRKGDKQAAMAVDEFIGQQEIVIKSLGKYLTQLFAISGATILGDGQVALIIDTNALIK